MRILVFLADGFEEIEAIIPVDVFRRANIKTVTVSISEISEVIGAHGIVLLADSVFSEIKSTEADVLFLPGGMPGTTNLAAHNGLKELLLSKQNTDTKIAAICAAPSVLGKLGLLAGKEAICYPGYEPQLLDAAISEKPVVRDENIFTAKAAGKSFELAFALVEALKGKSIADEIKETIFWR